MDRPYKRVMVKVSGNVLFNFDGAAKDKEDEDILTNLLEQVKNCQQQGVQVILVCGGGNLCRGRIMAKKGFKRTTADNIGMMATVINSMVLRERLTSLGCSCILMSSFQVGSMCIQFESYSAIRCLEEGNILISAGGTGNPFVTTDTAAAMRGIQTEVDALIKLTNVDGLYDKDPKKYADAREMKGVTYDYCLDHQIQVMDLSSFSLCKESNLPIHIASYKEPDVLIRIANGARVGTRVDRDGE